jgi:DNA-binding FrmR family transcriptional regulator
MWNLRDTITQVKNAFSQALQSILEKIIFDKTKQCLSDNEKSQSLKNNMKISQDYKKLLDLFQKRILFMAIFYHY